VDLTIEIKAIPRKTPEPKSESNVGLLSSILNRFNAPAGPTTEDLQTDHLWKRLNKNALYVRLRKNPDFRNLQTKFQEVIVKRKSHRPGSHAEFEFLFWVLGSARHYYRGLDLRRDRQSSRKGPIRAGNEPYADMRNATHQAIEKLRVLRTMGIRLDGYSKDSQLSELLNELDAQVLRKRKRRETDKSPATEALNMLAEMMCVRFDLSSPVILQRFDSWLGAEINSTTIHKISARARKEWVERVAGLR